MERFLYDCYTLPANRNKPQDFSTSDVQNPQDNENTGTILERFNDVASVGGLVFERFGGGGWKATVIYKAVAPKTRCCASTR